MVRVFAADEDGVGEMGEGQCWSVQADGSRCPGAAAAGSFFCSRHRFVRAGDASRVWRASEGEMPRELVAVLRLSDPGITFPTPEPGPPGDKGLAEPASETQPCVSLPDPEPGSSTHLAGVPSAPSSPEGETPGSPLDWLLSTLQAAMEGVMAGDATPLQKANAAARLAGLYLKAYGAKELGRENKALSRRLAAAESLVAELETRLAAVEGPAPPSSGLPMSEGTVPPAGSPEEVEREARRRAFRVPDDGWMTYSAGEPRARRAATGSVSPAAGAFAAVGRDPP
jgi:hypothetical protein